VRANPNDRAQQPHDKWATIFDDCAGLMHPPESRHWRTSSTRRRESSASRWPTTKSPKTSNHNFSMERFMNTEISAKFTAFAAAFTMNCLIFSGVAYMFDVPVKQNTPGIADSGQRRQCGCTPGGGDNSAR
jgi:hypothetical protein